jgi:hypothetical protein
MSGFTKLFGTIVTSTIWQEDSDTKVVWVTMLALADARGYVDATIPGLANIANVSIEKTREAVEKFLNPDTDSRTKENEGRRIQEVEGGWRLLNYEHYRQKRDPEKRRQQNREAKRRERQKQAENADCQPNVSQCQPMSAQAEAEAEAEFKKTPLISPRGDEGEKLHDLGSLKNSEAVQLVFEHWNQYAGQSVEKPGGQSGVKRILWKAHRILGKDKRLAIEQALKDYSVDDVCGAIDNFAMVLLGHEYFWSYPWSLHEFFTRGEEKHKAAARKWWAWLPDNFDAERYRRQGAADEIHIRDFTPEEDYEYYKQHPNPPMTAEQVNAEREKIGWPALSEAELAELPHTLDGLILVTADVREKWSAEYLERRKATVS